MKTPFDRGIRLGDILLERRLITPERLEEALALQQRWGSRLGDILLAKGWVRAQDFYRTLANHYQRPFVDLIADPPEAALFTGDDIVEYTRLLFLPWRRRGAQVVVAVADPGAEMLAAVHARFGDAVEFVITSKFDIIWQVQRHGDAQLTEEAVFSLAELRPEESARQVFTGRQIVELGLIAAAFLLALVVWPVPALIVVNSLVAFFFVVNFGLRALLTWVGAHHRIDQKITPAMVAALADKELPVYTVLVPMYREPETLPILTSALRKMDYPLSRLDVKLILEEGDTETIQAAKDLGLEGIFEIIRVPPSQPKTKPKACNYALKFARGQYVTIYDAEDKPEPDQLKKAVAAFRLLPAEVVCIQSRLNYFNANENWLTRMFTLEYSLWFDYYLPALETLRIPIPLGGTSNHFKMDALRELNAWDPFNVTEDADLGVRLTQRGYRVAVLNSTTYEEANSQLGNWIRQRSRWVKGYVQTYLVHMRKPRQLYRSLGPIGFWGFQFFVGGNTVTVLALPPVYAMFLIWLATGTTLFEPLFPPAVLYLSLFNLLFGNGLYVYISMLGAFKRRQFRLMPYALTAPFYWVLMSIAGYKGLWQLITNPFYWEKTQHGLTRFKHHELEPEPEQKAA